MHRAGAKSLTALRSSGPRSGRCSPRDTAFIRSRQVFSPAKTKEKPRIIGTCHDQEWLDSNQRVQESKSCALPLGDTPPWRYKTCQPDRLACKKGEWWGSNPRHPEPQSGALPLNYILHIAARKIKARLKGFEPLAHGLEGRCSIRLSYRRTPRGNRSGTLASRNQAREPAAILLTVYNYSGNRGICQYAIALNFRKFHFLTACAGTRAAPRA